MLGCVWTWTELEKFRIGYGEFGNGITSYENPIYKHNFGLPCDSVGPQLEGIRGGRHGRCRGAWPCWIL